MHSIDDYQKSYLRDGLNAQFNAEEIESLCFDLGVDYDNLAGKTKQAKIESLITQIAQQKRLDELLDRAAELRPGFQWRVGPAPDALAPYKGLFAFQEEDASYFFGREAFAEMLAGAVKGRSLVALLGASGSGKSSVVFAGLIPILRANGDWLMAHFRPGKEPFTALAAAVVPLLEPEMSKTDRQIEVRKVSRAWREGALTLAETLGDILVEQPAGTRLLLLADQFEELYTLVPDAEERHRFLDVWLGGGEADGVHQLLAMRADFLGQALAYRPLAQVLQEDDLKLAPMTVEELQAAIERPAQKAGVAFESGLVDRILEEIEDKPGNLPLLQFALTRLWDRQSDGQLTHEAYDAIGGVGGALAQYADEVYNRLAEEEQVRMRRIFVQLVQPGAGVEDTRRRATAREIGQENWQLVAQLATERLVVTGEDEDSQQQTVEVIHEALIQQWGQLQGWMGEDRAFRTWQENLRRQMSQWRASGQDEGGLLRGGLLAEAERWLGERPSDLSQEERAYIEAGIALRQAELAAVELRRQKELEQEQRLAEEQEARAREQEAAAAKLRQRLGYLAGALLVAAIAAVLAIFFGIVAGNSEEQAQNNLTTATAALIEAATSAVEAASRRDMAQRESTRAVQESTRAYEQQATAEAASTRAVSGEAAAETSLATAEAAEAEAQRQALLAHARAHAAEAETAIERNDARSAYLLAIQAVDTTYGSDGSIAGQADAALYHALAELPFGAALEGHSGPVNSASFNHDGSRIVTASDDGTARLWDGQGGFITALEGHSGTVLSASFNHDGSRIVTASRDWTARLWDGDGGFITSLEGHSYRVLSASFNHDGSRIVTASLDGTARLWDGQGGFITSLEGHSGPVYSASFNHDGSRIVTASDDGTARLWDGEGRFITSLKAYLYWVLSASFNHDGSRIVMTGCDEHGEMNACIKGPPRLWDSEGRFITDLEGHSGEVLSASFNHDGSRIVTTDSDRTARLWDGQGGFITALEGHSDSVNAASFNHDGSRIVTASDDGTARLWDGEGQFIAALEGHTAWVRTASFNHDGSRIVTAGCDELDDRGLYCGKGTARLWDGEGGFIIALEGHSAEVKSASFNHDGSRIVTAGCDDYDEDNRTCLEGTARLWEGEGRFITALEGHSRWVRSASFNHDGSRIVTAGDDGTARLWDGEGHLIVALEGHSSRIWSAGFNHDGSRIVTTGCDHADEYDVYCVKGTARLWDGEGGFITALEGHSAEVWSASFNHDGSRIVTASSDGTARLWEVWTGIDNMLSEATRRLMFLMTEEECLDLDYFDAPTCRSASGSESS